MKRVITSIFSMLSLDILIDSLPINNGFSLKFNAAHSKEDLTSKQFGEILANNIEDSKQRILTKTQYSPPFELGIGCTNQIAKIVVPVQYSPSNESTNTSEKSKVLHLPMVEHPYKDYKILVATAPAHMTLGRGSTERLLIYVVFPDDHSDGDDSAGAFAVPTVYFVNQSTSKMFSANGGLRDPVFLVNNNRTVTKLNSKQISKYVKFKNKLRDHFV